MRVRLYIKGAKKGQKVAFSKDQARHMRVLRLKKGALVRVFDGLGHEYEGVYSGKVSDGIVLQKAVLSKTEPKLRVTLAIAAPKGKRFDTLIEKVSEIGVENIVPILYSRSVVKPSESKIERLRKIIPEACAQSERTIVPTIERPMAFGALLSTVKQYNTVYLCHGTGKPLSTVMKPGKSALVIVGPEGDFTPAELDAAKAAGCVFVSLGPTTLRVETAGISAVTQLIGLSSKGL